MTDPYVERRLWTGRRKPSLAESVLVAGLPLQVDFIGQLLFCKRVHINLPVAHNTVTQCHLSLRVQV